MKYGRRGSSMECSAASLYITVALLTLSDSAKPLPLAIITLCSEQLVLAEGVGELRVYDSG